MDDKLDEERASPKKVKNHGFLSTTSNEGVRNLTNIRNGDENASTDNNDCTRKQSAQSCSKTRNQF